MAIKESTRDSFLFGAFIGAAAPIASAGLAYLFGKAVDGLRAIQEISDKNYAETWGFYAALVVSGCMIFKEGMHTDSPNENDRAFCKAAVATSCLTAASAIGLKLIY